MRLVSSVFALGLVLATGVAASSCGSDSSGGSPGGAGGAGSGTGGADAGTGAGGGTQVDAGMDSGTGGFPVDVNCGNGTVDPGEDCDDGNHTSGDGCEFNCKWTCITTVRGVCNDSNPCNGEETCDGATHKCQAAPANVPDGTVCGEAHKCQNGKCLPAKPDCGDKLVEDPEECDDGNTVSGDGCENNCKYTCATGDPTRNCSSGDICAGTGQCDDLATHTCSYTGQPPNGSSCGTGVVCVNHVCTDKYCGNKKVDGTEECDDGNNTPGDGCENDCTWTCLASDPTRNCKAASECFQDGTCDPGKHTCSTPVPKPAGTACGGGTKNCIAGSCEPVRCGDGIVAQGQEICDDGNLNPTDGCDVAQNCTKSCANPATDCTALACRTSQCTADGRCTSVADPSKNTNACSGGSGSATCNAGACTSGTCGDGNTDTGETCDFGSGNNVAGSGCEPNCQLTCKTAQDCDDGDPCNGTETCDTVVVGGKTGKKCNPGTSLADGTACAGGTKLCIGGGCRLSVCGDGITTAPEQCDPPNTVGCNADCTAKAKCNFASTSWAMKVTIGASWGGNAALQQMSGNLVEYARLDFSSGSTGTNLSGTLRPCGIDIPDFQASDGFNDEWYGVHFPDAAFDSAKMPNIPFNASLTNQAPGATFTTGTIVVLLGIQFTPPADPFGSWTQRWSDMASTSGVSLPDQDNDKIPAITALVKTGKRPDGSSYSDVPANLDNLPDVLRADQLYLAIRQASSQSGTLESCTSLQGQLDGTSIDNHITACHLDTGAPCTADDAALVDGARPIYTVSSATFTAAKVAAGASCATVRGTVP